MARVSSYPLGTLPGTVYAIVGGLPRRVVLQGMAGQQPNAVAITGGSISGVGISGGSINGAPIGQSTAAAGTFTNARVNALGVGQAVGAELLRVARAVGGITDAVSQMTAQSSGAAQGVGLRLLYSKSVSMSVLNGVALEFAAESTDKPFYVMGRIQSITDGLSQNVIRIAVLNGASPVNYDFDRLGNLSLPTSYRVLGVQVVAARRTGWGVPSGTATRTTFTTGTVTLAQLAERVKALIDDLTAHGLIGA